MRVHMYPRRPRRNGRALDGIAGPTALDLCFRSAYAARDKPDRYAFLPELAASRAEQQLML